MNHSKASAQLTAIKNYLTACRAGHAQHSEERNDGIIQSLTQIISQHDKAHRDAQSLNNAHHQFDIRLTAQLHSKGDTLHLTFNHPDLPTYLAIHQLKFISKTIKKGINELDTPAINTAPITQPIRISIK